MDSIISEVKRLEQTKNTLLTYLFQYHVCQQTGTTLPKETQESLSRLFSGNKELISFNLPGSDKIYYLENDTIQTGRKTVVFYEMDEALANLKAVGEIELGDTSLF